jgi:hypothetical protein
MNLKKQLSFTIIAWFILAVFLVLSQPDKLPVVLLILPFVLLFIALYSLWTLAQQVRVRLLINGKPHRHLGAVVCASVVLLIVLQSLGQLTLRDVLTIAGIVVIGYLYLGRTILRLTHH